LRKCREGLGRANILVKQWASLSYAYIVLVEKKKQAILTGTALCLHPKPTLVVRLHAVELVAVTHFIQL
jgi:hypothetical protein